MNTKALPNVGNAHGAPMGRGWPHIGEYAATLVSMYETTPPRDDNERRHYQCAKAALVNGSCTGRVSLRRVRLDTGGYDSGGAYWGIGQPLYYAASDDGTVDLWFRASTRNAAKQYVLTKFPQARFYR